MEDPTSFSLNEAIARWAEGLRQSPHFRPDNLAELEEHLRDSVAGFQQKGLTEEEGFWLAARRLGNAPELEPEFAKINRGNVWLNRVLWMLIGIQLWAVVCAVSAMVTNTALFGALAGMPRESLSHAGQLWTRSALLGTLYGLLNIGILAACVAGVWRLIRHKENAARNLLIRAARRPVTWGVAAGVIILMSRALPSVWLPLLAHRYPASTIGLVSISMSLSGAAVVLLQTLLFAIITLVLLRRRFCPVEMKI